MGRLTIEVGRKAAVVQGSQVARFMSGCGGLHPVVERPEVGSAA